MPYVFAGNGTSTIAAAQLGALSKLYLCPLANIGADNAAALVHASLEEVGLSSQHAIDPGLEFVETEPLQALGGTTAAVVGVPKPMLKFRLSAITKETEQANELNLFRVAHLTGVPLWLMSLTNAKTVPGAFGLYGLWSVKMTENKNQANEIISYDVECRQAFTTTHLVAPYIVPAS